MRFFVSRLPFYTTYWHTRTPDAISIYCEQPTYNWENKKIETHNTQVLPAFIVFNLDFSLFSFFLRSSLALQLHMCTHIDWCSLPDIEMNVWHSELWIVITCSSVAHVPENYFGNISSLASCRSLGQSSVCVCQCQENILCCHLANRSVFAFYFNN